MSKTVGSLIMGVVTLGVGIVTANPYLIASGALQIAGTVAAIAFAPPAPKPDTVSTAIKVSRPPRVSRYGQGRLYGAYILYETAPDGTAIDIYAFHDGEMSELIGFYLNDDPVFLSGNTVQAGADGRYGKNKLRIQWTSGTALGTSLSIATSLLGGLWGANHRGDGVVIAGLFCGTVKQEDFLKIYPNGVPTLSMAAKWQKCPDLHAADPTNPAGWTWTENPIRQLAHYMLMREGVDYATKIAPTIAYWRAAQDVCDEPVPLKGGGTEPRYRSCIAHKHTDAHKQVEAALLTACDGWMAPGPNGAFIVYAGKFTAPTATLTPDEIVAFDWDGVGVDDDKAVNEIVCSYVSAQHAWNTVETDAWIDEDDILDRGQVLSDELDPQVPSHGQVRRLAKRKMARSNALHCGTVATNVAGRIVRGHRYINLRIIEAGAVFFDGPAEITALTRNMLTGGVTFSWVAAVANVDAWNPATEEGEPAANGDRVAGAPLDPPAINSAFTQFISTTDEGTGARIAIEATGPNRDDLTWYARWRAVSDSAWNEAAYTDTAPGAAVELLTALVPAQDDIEVEVAYGVGDGRVSAWSGPQTVSTATDETPPDAATAITLVSWSDAINLTTDTIPRASSYRWRFYAADGTTLIRTIITATRSVSYTAQQAATDVARRSYVVKVAGINTAGAGAEAATGVLTNAAPSTVTGMSATGGATNGQVSFTTLSEPDVAGYVTYVSTVSGFDPLTQGFSVKSLDSPAYLQGLAAGTFYAKTAAYDLWTDRPDLLNFSSQVSFVITTGGGGTGSGGGGGGGGYCVTTDTLILMADGTEKPAGELVVGDLVRTQHELSLAWGDHAVTAVEIVASDDVWRVNIGTGELRATGDHRLWLSGWVKMREIGAPTEPAEVVRITVADAHTYVSNGVLSHNLKPVGPD